MPKVAPDAMIDAALDYVAGATAMHACSTLDATPTLAEVTAASLADVTMAGGDYTKADGDTSGRKVTVAAKSGVTVDASGTANHIALVDGSVVRYVTTCTSQALTSGNTVNFPAWKIEIADPT
jgi:uncharacterized metal-binding protein